MDAAHQPSIFLWLFDSEILSPISNLISCISPGGVNDNPICKQKSYNLFTMSASDNKMKGLRKPEEHKSLPNKLMYGGQMLATSIQKGRHRTRLYDAM